MDNKKETVNGNEEVLTEETVNEDATQETQEETCECDTEEVTDDNDSKNDKKSQEIDALKDKLVRSMAEFDNYRKRTEKEKSAMFEVGAKSIVEKILPVIDNFERGFAAASDSEKESPFFEGISKIYQQMMTALEEAGVKPIEAVGKQFDPDYHNAVMHIDDEEYGENEVAEEFQKGYMYKESVVRHSMVKVAN